MSEALSPVRRLVTAVRADGSSYIAEDGPAPAVRTEPARPGFRVNNIWVTGATPAPIAAADGSLAHKGILPPKQGTVLRIIDMPPEADDPMERKRQFEATFKGMFADADHTGTGHAHPGMHTTDTVDYAIVLSGEIYAVMDEGETLMRAGDVLVQRGTNHAWANRSGGPCRIAFVLIDGVAG